jgi:IS30 family transposase
MEGKSDTRVFEMDTVKGKRGHGKVMLTMLFRKNSVMLIFLIPRRMHGSNCVKPYAQRTSRIS